MHINKIWDYPESWSTNNPPPYFDFDFSLLNLASAGGPNPTGL